MPPSTPRPVSSITDSPRRSGIGKRAEVVRAVWLGSSDCDQLLDAIGLLRCHRRAAGAIPRARGGSKGTVDRRKW